MAQITFELGDLVGDENAQIGVVFEEDRALVMYRDGASFRPVVKSAKSHGFLPLHSGALKTIPPEVKLALLAVITALNLKNNFPGKDSYIVNNFRDK